MEKNLTKKQIERQDFVDNQIFELMQELLLYSGKTIDWNIEIIAEIRDEISCEFTQRNIIGEFDFYPYLRQ